MDNIVPQLFAHYSKLAAKCTAKARDQSLSESSRLKFWRASKKLRGKADACLSLQLSSVE